MEFKSQENSRPFIRETCENLASTGLRTLCISQKYVTQEEYTTWSTRYELAKAEMQDRETKVQRVVDQLEEGMELLCVTGVEDKLQIDVADTIESLRNGGVQIWMLTGDKVETATCIAISTGLKSKAQKFFYMKELKNTVEVERLLKEFEQLQKTVLVIDGNTMSLALRPEIEEIFFKIAARVKTSYLIYSPLL